MPVAKGLGMGLVILTSIWLISCFDSQTKEPQEEIGSHTDAQQKLPKINMPKRSANHKISYNLVNPISQTKIFINKLPQKYELTTERFYPSFSLFGFRGNSKRFTILCSQNIGVDGLRSIKDSLERKSTEKVVYYSPNRLTFSENTYNDNIVDVCLIKNATIRFIREDTSSPSNTEIANLLKEIRVDKVAFVDSFLMDMKDLKANIKFPKNLDILSILGESKYVNIEFVDETNSKYTLYFTNDSIYYATDFITRREYSRYRHVLDSLAKSPDLKRYITDIQGNKYIFNHHGLTFYSPSRTIILYGEYINDLLANDELENYRSILSGFGFQALSPLDE